MMNCNESYWCCVVLGAAWWYKPEYIITELNINSVITAPCHEEILPINSWTAQRPYTLRGYAYSGLYSSCPPTLLAASNNMLNADVVGVIWLKNSDDIFWGLCSSSHKKNMFWLG